jgi:PIN domain nuclease of toxin-antitoxin system
VKQGYLLDTHALLFWVDGSLGEEFVAFLDDQNQQGRLFVSDISFWEIALLVNKGRLELEIVDVMAWAAEFLAVSGIRTLSPTMTEMIQSVALPPHHKDPFDRLLIAQAVNQQCVLVSRDTAVQAYDIEIFWL